MISEHNCQRLWIGCFSNWYLGHTSRSADVDQNEWLGA